MSRKNEAQVYQVVACRKRTSIKVLKSVLKYQVCRMLSVEGVTVAVDNAGLVGNCRDERSRDSRLGDGRSVCVPVAGKHEVMNNAV